MEHNHELKGKALLFLFFFWCLWFINFTVRAIFSPVLPLVEDEFVISHAKATSIFIFQSTGYAVSVLLSGFYSSRFGYKKTILCSLIMASAIFLSIFFVKNFQLFYVFTFLLGFATGLYLPSAISLITEYFAERDWGKSISIHDTAAPILYPSLHLSRFSCFIFSNGERFLESLQLFFLPAQSFSTLSATR